MKNRKFLTAVIAVMLSCALAACGGQTGTQQTTIAAAAEAAAETAASAQITAEEVTKAAAEETVAENAEAKTEASEEASEAGGASAESSAAGEVSGPVTITDMLGREITLEQPATRVVALTPSDCEILFAIGAGDTLVGRGEYCDYPAAVLDIPAVQSGAETNIEEILALEPQLLIMSAMSQTEEQAAQLEAAGVQVVISDAQDIAGVYTAIEMIGKLMGRDESAAEVIDNMKAIFAEIEEKSTGDGSKTIYFEVSPLEYGLYTAGAHTFMDEVANMLGVKNCFADVEGWGAISEEQVLKRNPDYIMTITMYYGEGPTPEEEILGRAGWENVTAVKNKAILNLVDNELSRPAPRLADGARKLYDFVYGEDAE